MDRHTPTPPYCSGGCGVSRLETENHKSLQGLSSAEGISFIMAELEMQKALICKCEDFLHFDIRDQPNMVPPLPSLFHCPLIWKTVAFWVPSSNVYFLVLTKDTIDKHCENKQRIS